MSIQVTLWVSPSAISSPGSADGPAPCGLPDGLMTAECGPEVVRANLSARQAKEVGLLTSGTCGRPGTISSKSVALQSSLESRLRAVLLSSGSTLYKLTWKAWATPSGPSRSRLRASALRTSETGFTGWPTPTSALATKGVRTFEGGLIEAMRNHGPDLAAAACLAGWQTPRSQISGDTAETHEARQASVVERHGRRMGTPLEVQAQWCQPARYTASGVMLTGSSAAMGSGGQLNPAHSRWLMGYPPEWDACAVTAMPSSRRLRKRL